MCKFSYEIRLLGLQARREKISKKMKFLQDLVPGCDKVTGKAGMLDEIINYVQSLQKQVEVSIAKFFFLAVKSLLSESNFNCLLSISFQFLSMKLAVLNPGLDFNLDNFIAKEVKISFTFLHFIKSSTFRVICTIAVG